MKVEYDSGDVYHAFNAICKSIDRLATAEALEKKESDEQLKELYWKFKYTELQYYVERFLYGIQSTEDVEEAIKENARTVIDNACKVIERLKNK